jgi:hypothetical protein
MASGSTAIAAAELAQAVEAEVATFLGDHAAKLTDDGNQRLVRHGHLPEREIMTGIGGPRCHAISLRAWPGYPHVLPNIQGQSVRR